VPGLEVKRRFSRSSLADDVAEAVAALLRDTSDSRADGIVEAVNEGALSRLDGISLAIGLLSELENAAATRTTT
jgi:hypothetical protein